MLFRTTFLLVGFAFKSPKTSSFCIFLYRNSSSTKATDSTKTSKNEWIISLLLILIALQSLSLNHYIMCYVSVGEETSSGFPWKRYCYSSPSQLTRENIFSGPAFCLSFIFFGFVFWPIETTTENVQGLTHSNPAKFTNQVTLSNEHMNYPFWV